VEHVPIYEQVAHAQFLARVWADNAVSFTGTVSAREHHLLKQLLPLAIPTVKSLSFLINQNEKQSYKQLPYEGITIEEFERRSKQIKDIDWSDFGGSDGQDSMFCDADVCELPI
jgi:ribonucleoside-diphosphate reductase alpha chain